ncbi:myosin heavy chain, skeletal muscle, adult [Cladorrhinum sp. PSN332]|nr:myosin heavy chain, skeletal muscle, adult [Cladorrhinum sp. PSN332]
MIEKSDIPIALRRSRRRSSGGAVHVRAPSVPGSSSATRKRKAITPKRVRFSDPGAVLSTGLTPIFQRTSLLTTPLSGEVHFAPLRQVLDGRIKRRIRRNGLSEEMNNIYAERKRRAEETKAEIERLKAELSEKDEEIERLQDQTIEIDSDRIWGLERQVEELKKELAAQSRNQRQQQQLQEPTPDNSGLEWSSPSRDPFQTAFMHLESQYDDGHDQFGEATMADLISSTPTRARSRALHTSFLSPPLTSPVPPEHDPGTPCSRRSRSALRYAQSATPTSFSDQGIQTSPDPETALLRDEIASLNLEIAKLTTTLESYSRLSNEFGISSSSSSSSSSQAEELESLLTTLTEQTSALSNLKAQISALGFPGADEIQMINSVRSAFRAARLELEYLTPGEITLPLTCSGAGVMDLLLLRLRELGKMNKEKDESIDEYHSIETSLRAQLNARVDAMGILRKELEGREGRVLELEWEVERLRSELRRGEEEREERGLESDVEDKKARIEELETLLQVSVEESRALELGLEEYKSEVGRLEAELAGRDEMIGGLKKEVERVGGELKVACETVRRLRVENGELRVENEELWGENAEMARTVEDKKKRSREVMETLTGLAVKMGEGLRTPESNKRTRRKRMVSPLGLEDETEKDVRNAGSERVVGDEGLLSADLSERANKSKRRKYDSGMGLLEEDELDI